MGLFYDFIDELVVWLIGIEVVGESIVFGKYVVILIMGKLGVLYGVMSYLFQDKEG